MIAVELLPPGEARPDNPRWHEIRRQGVTASEIPIILGLSSWESPWSLWHRKRGLIGDPEAGESADWGRRLEPVIAEAAMEQIERDWPLSMAYPAGLYARPGRPWQMATPDRLVASRPADDPGTRLVGLLEIKHPYSWDGWGDEGTDDVPAAYLAQCLWQLDVMDLDQCWLAAYSRHSMRIYEIRRDAEGADADLELMRKLAHEFLTSEEPPPLDSHPATIAGLKALHPSIEDREEWVPADVAGAYRRARAELAAAEARAKQAEAELRAAMGSARYAVDPQGVPVASRSVYTRRGIDTKRLRADHPDIVATYATESTVDRLYPRKDPNVED